MFLERLISGTLPFAFLMICGIYLSFKTEFCQITRFGESFKLTARAFKNRTKTREITSYKAACTALSASSLLTLKTKHFMIHLKLLLFFFMM